MAIDANIDDQALVHERKHTHIDKGFKNKSTILQQQQTCTHTHTHTLTLARMITCSHCSMNGCDGRTCKMAKAQEIKAKSCILDQESSEIKWET